MPTPPPRPPHPRSSAPWPTPSRSCRCWTGAWPTPPWRRCSSSLPAPSAPRPPTDPAIRGQAGALHGSQLDAAAWCAGMQEVMGDQGCGKHMLCVHFSASLRAGPGCGRSVVSLLLGTVQGQRLLLPHRPAASAACQGCSCTREAAFDLVDAGHTSYVFCA